MIFIWYTVPPKKSTCEPIKCLDPVGIFPEVNHKPLVQVSKLYACSSQLSGTASSASLELGSHVGDKTSDELLGQPSRGVYEFLDVENLSEDNLHILKGRLTKDYKQITAHFARLTEHVRCSLSNRGVTPKQLFMVLMNLSAFALRKKDDDKPLLEDCCDNIQDAESIDDVFCTLRPYVSFFDCHIIKHIVSSNLCTNDDKEQLDRYIKELDSFCQRSVFECPHIANSDPQLLNLVMKVEDTVVKSFSVKTMDEFRAKLAETLGLKGYTLHLRSVEKGCLKLTFQIPRFIMTIIFPLSTEEEAKLSALGVLKLTCEGTEYNFGLQEFQQPKV